MASGSDRRVALFSIKPRYADAILDGSKQVELRRSHVPEDLTHVLIYASSPEQAIVGWFEVARVEQASPTEIWRRHGSLVGVTRREFRSYLAGSRTAFAIVIGRIVRLPSSIQLREVVPDGVAPQSFRYLTPEVFEALVERALPVPG
jgi:predicted transcriptional regulator